MGSLMHTYTCHSRWCPEYLPSFMNNSTGLPLTALCNNVTWTLENVFNSSENQTLIKYNKWLFPACKLWCGEPSYQFLQLQTAGLSRQMAIFIWFLAIMLTACVGIQLVLICLERGARKVAMVGGPLFLSFMALMVYFSISYNTEFYPIVGAMNVAAFSYYFSSFQYSIGMTYELASGTALVFTMSPVWTLITGNRFFEEEHFAIHDTVLLREMVWVVLAMLMLSIGWITHSSIYRTVMYRATWIAAFNKQAEEGRAQAGRDFMSRLWILSGAQGHPTWRTPTGQSFGLYLAGLSWVGTLKIHTYLTRGKYCTEDLILFHILLWIPPVILTLAVLVTLVCMCRKVSFETQGNIRSLFWEWLVVDFESLVQSRAVVEALISYKMGRDTLEVEDSNKVRKYKTSLCCGKVFDDDSVAYLLWSAEAALVLVAVPGILVCKISQWLGICILRCTSPFTWCQSSPGFELSEKIKAYQIVRERCFTEIVHDINGDKIDYYELSKETHASSAGALETAIVEDFRTMLRIYRKDITLPLVLDNIGPKCFSHVLETLVEVLNENHVEVVKSTGKPELPEVGEAANDTEGPESPEVEEAANDTEGLELPEIQEANSTGILHERHEDQEAANGANRHEWPVDQGTTGTSQHECVVSVASSETEQQNQNQI